ncbi:MAG: histidine phosphatase family protein [Lachnospiraceae bacterium]|nr:histidine phosphatase family protein [Lachnospiraceae bacterium]
MKTILLMRHSIPSKDKLSEEGILLTEKVKTSVHEKYQNVYSSPIVRAYETAQIFSSNVQVIPDLKEREIGIAKEDFWLKQYQNYNYKNQDGESLNETKLRMRHAIDFILKQMSEDSCSLVISHATAICAYLSNYCIVNVIDANNKTRNVIFGGKEIFIDNLYYTSYFVLKFNGTDLVDITYHCNKSFLNDLSCNN